MWGKAYLCQGCRKSIPLYTTVGNVENLTCFGGQRRSWKYLLKHVDTIVLFLEPSSAELKIPAHREACRVIYSCIVQRGKTWKQSEYTLTRKQLTKIGTFT